MTMQTTEPISYATFNPETRALTGGYLQAVPPEHAEYIAVSDAVRIDWPMYRLNEAGDGVELLEIAVPDLPALKAAKNAEINTWRAAANLSTFPYAGKTIAYDALSRSDIDGVANHIALFEAFPAGFPGAWKAVDNTLLPLPDVDAFRAMYASMTAQGTENFNHSQSLKAALALASTPEEVAAIEW